MYISLWKIAFLEAKEWDMYYKQWIMGGWVFQVLAHTKENHKLVCFSTTGEELYVNLAQLYPMNNY